MSESTSTPRINWSWPGRLALIGVPILFYLVAAAATQELKAAREPTADLMLVAFAMGAFMGRLGAIGLEFLCLYRVFFSYPGPDTPRWMTRAAN